MNRDSLLTEVLGVHTSPFLDTYICGPEKFPLLSRNGPLIYYVGHGFKKIQVWYLNATGPFMIVLNPLFSLLFLLVSFLPRG